MTRQEEIKHWFCRYLAQFNGQLDYDNLPQHRKDGYKMMVEEDIMPYLHSQNVVVKVKRESPLPNFENTRVGVERFEIQLATQRDMFKAGYVAVESLIQEK